MAAFPLVERAKVRPYARRRRDDKATFYAPLNEGMVCYGAFVRKALAGHPEALRKDLA